MLFGFFWGLGFYLHYQYCSHKAYIFKYSYTGVHNLSSPFSRGLKKRLVSFPSPAPKHTITHSHTLLHTAWPCIFLNLSQLSSLRVQILVAASQLQSGWAVAVFLNLQIWLVLLQLRCGDRVGSVCICTYVCVCVSVWTEWAVCWVCWLTPGPGPFSSARQIGFRQCRPL